MNNMPKKIREGCLGDPYYDICARSNEDCEGRITWEHALLYAGKQIQERFAIIPLCEYHHLGDGLVKRHNVNIAMARATKTDKEKYQNLKWSIYE